MPYIGKQLVRGQNRELDDISSSFNGATTTFNLTVGGDSVTPGSALQLFISIGGVLQNPNTDFTVAGNQITFSTAPGSGLSFFGYLQGDAVDFNTPADGSVTTSKLGSNLTINVADGSAATPSIQFNGSGTDTGFYSPAADEVAVSTGGSGRLFIDSSGNVGIGTTSPSATVEIRGSDNTLISAKGNLFVADGGTATQAAGEGGQISLGAWLNGDLSAPYPMATIKGISESSATNSNGGALLFGTGSAATLVSERARIDSYGRLLVGTSSYFAYTSTNRVYVGFDGLGAEYGMVLSALNGIQGGMRWLEFASNATVVGSVDWSGSAVRYNTSSDYRLKENIVSISDASSRLKQLKPRRFNFIDFPDQTVDGFIAHEAQEVVPEAISGVKDEIDEKGNPKYQGIDQSKLVPLLTAALQEAMERIETLEAKVAALEAA